MSTWLDRKGRQPRIGLRSHARRLAITLLSALAIGAAVLLPTMRAQAQVAAMDILFAPVIIDPTTPPEPGLTFGNPAARYALKGTLGLTGAPSAIETSSPTTGEQYRADYTGAFLTLDKELQIAPGATEAQKQSGSGIAGVTNAVLAADRIDLRSTNPASLMQKATTTGTLVALHLIGHISVGYSTGTAVLQNSTHQMEVQRETRGFVWTTRYINLGYAEGQETIRDQDAATQAVISAGTRPVQMEGIDLDLGPFELEQFYVAKADYPYQGAQIGGSTLLGTRAALHLLLFNGDTYFGAGMIGYKWFDLSQTGKSNLHTEQQDFGLVFGSRDLVFVLSYSQTSAGLANTNFIGLTIAASQSDSPSSSSSSSSRKESSSSRGTSSSGSR